MTISTTINRYAFTGDGTTVAFAYASRFLANEDLKVYQDTTLKTITTHYTVTGAGDAGGGMVTFATAPASGESVVILGDPEITQSTDWVENDPDPAAQKEDAVDLLTLICQRLSDRLDRSFTLADSDVSGIDLTFPAPVANKLVATDSQGTSLVLADFIDNIFVNQESAPPTDGSLYMWQKTSTGDVYFLKDGAWVSFSEMLKVSENFSSAKASDPNRFDLMFVKSDDGGLFKSVTGAAPGTYANNGGSYCGTIIIKDGGDGSSAWVRVSDHIDASMFGVEGSGDETSKFQTIVNSLSKENAVVHVTKSATVTPVTASEGKITWVLGRDVSIESGALPGTITRLGQVRTVGTPESVIVFGVNPYSFEVTVNSVGGIAAQSSSGVISKTVNGLSSGDRLIATPRIDTFTDGLVMYAVDLNGNNNIGVRFVNPTAATITPNDRKITVTVARNDSYRQVFAVSRILSGDTLLAAVDTEGRYASTIWRSVNFGSTWDAVYATNSLAVREIIVVSATTVIAVCSDPSVAGEFVYRSTDGGDTWAAVTLPLSATDTESVIFSGEVEGGEGSGGNVIVLGAGRKNGADATVYRSTDGGATFGSPVVVAPSAGYDHVWDCLWSSGNTFLAFLHDNASGTKSPAIYKSTDSGATWSLSSTVGAAGDKWQSAFVTSSGTILAGTDNSGYLYRSTDGGSTWSNVFSAAAIKSSETKIRDFGENSYGVFAISQDGGFVWKSIDDGLTWNREVRIGRLFGPISMHVSDQGIIVGGGQGYATGDPAKAEIYRLPITHFNDSEL